MLGSPLVLTINQRGAAARAAPVVLVWLALGVLSSSPWVFGQFRRFVPIEEK
jgi:hypothetical protein